MISFDSDCGFELSQADEVAEWMQSIAGHYDKEIRFIDVVFRADASIHQMNMEHLQHDYPTDILTFDYTEEGPIEAELHIGI
ncbi:MAG: rRNA maturation RNAse YbeY, partial [Bacteroidetes bacterium]|nr:rRNA maturation RNAse YbeY [Bacteroidota bacterium]